MSTVNQKMTAIADAVREKTGQTEPLTLDDLASAISIYTTDANATSDNILEGMTAYVNNQLIQGKMPNIGKVVKTVGAGQPVYQIPKGYHSGEGGVTIDFENTLKITPQEESQIFSPKIGKAFNIIECNSIPSSYIVKNEIENQNILLDEVVTKLNNLTNEENLSVDITLHRNSDDIFLIQYLDNNFIPYNLIMEQETSQFEIKVLKNSIIYIQPKEKNRIISSVFLPSSENNVKIYDNKSIIGCQVTGDAHIIFTGSDIE